MLGVSEQVGYPLFLKTTDPGQSLVAINPHTLQEMEGRTPLRFFHRDSDVTATASFLLMRVANFPLNCLISRGNLLSSRVSFTSWIMAGPAGFSDAGDRGVSLIRPAEVHESLPANRNV